jgi:acyl-CoA reductase-like NAD-dependent aldehyde dehydrogenase
VSGKTFQTIDPRTEETIVEVAAADKEDVNLAVNAARKAFETGPWRKMSGRERGKILYRLADLMEAHKEELAVLETLDNGKPLSLSRNSDVPLAIDHYRCVRRGEREERGAGRTSRDRGLVPRRAPTSPRITWLINAPALCSSSLFPSALFGRTIHRYFAGWADKIHGQTIPVDGPFFAYTLREPVGVVGQIVGRGGGKGAGRWEGGAEGNGGRRPGRECRCPSRPDPLDPSACRLDPRPSLPFF